MFQKATTELLLSDCSPRDIERLACQSYAFGASLLTGRAGPALSAARKQGKVYAETAKKSVEDLDADLLRKDKARAAEDAVVWLQMTLKLVVREGCLGDINASKRTETQNRFYDINVRLGILTSGSAD